MVSCKTNISDFFGWNFFLQKCLNLLFNLVVKHSPDKRRANRVDKKKNREKFRIWTNTLKEINQRVLALWSLAPHQHILTKEPKRMVFSCSTLLHSLCTPNILSLFFSETKCKMGKKIQGNVFLLNWKGHAKIQALLKKKKISPEKVNYISLAPSHSIRLLI